MTHKELIALQLFCAHREAVGYSKDDNWGRWMELGPQKQEFYYKLAGILLKLKIEEIDNYIPLYADKDEFRFMTMCADTKE